jgi:hypothetical protein
VGDKRAVGRAVGGTSVGKAVGVNVGVSVTVGAVSKTGTSIAVGWFKTALLPAQAVNKTLTTNNENNLFMYTLP